VIILSASAPVPQHEVHALYSNHHGWLLGWLRGKLGNAFDAADLTHDTFERLLSRLDRPMLRDPRAYLATIAHGLVVNHWRRLEIERAYLDTLLLVPESLAQSPEERALLLETLCEIDAMLDRLNSKARAAFLMAQLDGLTYGDIAQRIGVSERMIKKYMVQAMLHCLQFAEEHL
jgi:RNA polymerase sigma-70 factor (ECF subfamily)